MNVLRQSGIANTPVGQLIVAAAIIDDMVACK
jgi:Kef-type K+ transport system membrane component KefB